MLFVCRVKGNCPTFSHLLPVILVFMMGIIPFTRAISKCHSCFSGCQNVDECDCTSLDNQTCQGDFCYVKLDRLSDNGLGFIRKGCANWAPDAYVDVCQYVTSNSTIECYCKGDQCNTVTHFDHYHIKPLPMVSCCECEGYDYENGTIECLADECLRNCTGHFCYNDLVSQAQGCGWGHSLAWQFVRNSHRVDEPSNSTALLPWSPHEGGMTCAEGYVDSSTLLRGCTCASDFCNIVNTANFYATNITENRATTEHYCYAVHAISSKPITGDAYRRSTTCPGHFCFVTMTTSVLSYGAAAPNGSVWDEQHNLSSTLAPDSDAWPTMVTRHEMMAGCLLVDDESKVETGCTTEWSESEDKPSKKHCICAGHICNYLNLITGEDKRSLLAFDWKTSKDYKTVSSSATGLLRSIFWITVAFVTVRFCA